MDAQKRSVAPPSWAVPPAKSWPALEPASRFPFYGCEYDERKFDFRPSRTEPKISKEFEKPKFGEHIDPSLAQNCDDVNTGFPFLALFLTYLPLSLFETIADFTNLHFQLCHPHFPRGVNGRDKHWRPTTGKEILAFVFVHKALGVVGHKNYAKAWSSNVAFACEFVKKAMSCNRFRILKKYIRFHRGVVANEETLDQVRCIYDCVVENFLNVHSPLSQNLAHDEFLVSFQGNCPILTFIPTKAHRKGLLFYLLCDKSGFVCNVWIDAKNCDEFPSADPGFGVIDNLTAFMVGPFLGRGFNFFFRPEVWTCDYRSLVVIEKS